MPAQRQEQQQGVEATYCEMSSGRAPGRCHIASRRPSCLSASCLLPILPPCRDADVFLTAELTYTSQRPGHVSGSRSLTHSVSRPPTRGVSANAHRPDGRRKHTRSTTKRPLPTLHLLLRRHAPSSTSSPARNPSPDAAWAPASALGVLPAPRNQPGLHP